MKITVFGAGYVGLTCAIGYAVMGHQVYCVDIDESRIHQLQSGICPIHEPNMQQHLQAFKEFPLIDNLGSLNFTTDSNLALSDSKISLICVGTPSLDNGDLDIRGVLQAFSTITHQCDANHIVMVKSTVPVGTVRKMKTLMGVLKEIQLWFSPEFLQEGSCLRDFFNPQRIVMAGPTKNFPGNQDWLFELMQLPNTGFPVPGIIFTDYETAELSKLAANAMLATRISFMNEISNLSEKVQADIHDIEKILGSDNRIGEKYLHAGIGWGGYCLPKDVSMLVNLQNQHGIHNSLISSALCVNKQQPNKFIDAIFSKYQVNDKLPPGSTLAIWGCAFKPNTDDCRDSPAIKVIEGLLNRGFAIRLFDPVAVMHHQSCDFVQVPDILDSLMGVDGIVLLTDWDEFKSFKASLAIEIRKKIIFDGRGCLDPKNWQNLGFEFHGIGFNPVNTIINSPTL